ncbi:acyl-CoA dehydrogenase family protein [Streptomyces sp. NPDC094448]|uniref:acyl-CoA dehydrogenase family protein n=1 Tax=Streptomyces sp. NPDC094448 TaxID=3366063 RepID=UPI00380B8708
MNARPATARIAPSGRTDQERDQPAERDVRIAQSGRTDQERGESAERDAEASRTVHRSAVEALDSVLGAPGDEHASFRPGALAELDRREAFPSAACRVLDDFGLPAHYVPVTAGGRLDDHTELMLLLRTVARRDLTVAVAHGKTFLGAASVWVAGTAEQAGRTGQLVLSGAIASWGLTERQYGSDLLAGQVTAVRTADGGWLIDGEKWLINNATRGHLVCVLARTEPDGGPRGFSLLLVDKRRLTEGSFTCLPKVPTHGIRGADISGIAFQRAEVPAAALVGETGAGVEIVLKALQLTRTICVALSLGAGDTAVRIAADYARGRRLYGRTLSELPRIRRILGEITAAQLLAEATAIVAGRSIHALTGEMSVTSAVTKALVPDLVQGILDRTAELLGVRSFLTEEYADGTFAKLERDHRVVAIFDGNTAVNRNALIDQFPLLATGYRRGRTDPAAVAAATRLAVPVPEFDRAGLALISQGGCSVVQSLPDAVARVRALAETGQIPAEAADLAERIRDETDLLHQDLGARRRTARDVPASAFAQAERYELCFAAAACLHLWLNNAPDAADPGGPPTVWHDALWLRACLSTVLTRLGHSPGAAGPDAYDRLADHALGASTPTLTAALGPRVATRSAS